MSRRGFLTFTGLGVVAATLTTGCATSSRSARSTVGRIEFRNPLQVPPLAEAARKNGTVSFDLVAQKGRTRVVEQGIADTWGVNGPFLGPTLRAARGETVRIRFTNELDETTTLHWHGMHVPPEADGGPHQAVEPGRSWEPSWRVNQPAATLWYHPHPHGETERHVYQGIAGLFILDDPEESALALPRDYGTDDIPLIVQDKTFDSSGQLIETTRKNNGMLGETVLVNGTAAPVLEATAERTRLRILNGSTARTYSFGFADGRAFTMIGSDGGLLPAPVRLEQILLTPGERAEIVVEMRPGEDVVLRSFPHDLGVTRGMAESTGASDELDILLLRAARSLTPSPEVPGRLARVERLKEADAVNVRSFELRTNRINGLSMDMDRIDEVVVVDTVEIWEVWNDHGQPHNFHVHDVQFQVLTIDGKAPPPELAGWKDTVYLPPHQRFRLIMRFTEYTSTEVPYMYHCHILWHEDQGMMGHFVVVEPGQEGEVKTGDPEAGRRTENGHNHH